ncbi:MAG: M42 family peptidase, partial [Lentisphaeria bacterium]|nr:M42 family peptidase [Lentisphaeria bacterium]
MLSDTSLAFLERFMNCNGPSGFEFEAAECFRNYAKDFAHKVITDVMGNTIAVLNPDAPVKVMLAGHYDEIGFQVTYITDEGFICFRPVGGVDKNTVPGLEVNILTEKGPLPGVIGRKAIHLQSQKERDTPSEFKDLWIDTGIEDGAKVKELVTVGDAVSFRTNYHRAG